MSGSMNQPSGEIGILPERSYGYFDSYSTGTITCSKVHTDSMPAASACRTTSIMRSAVCDPPTLIGTIPIFMREVIPRLSGAVSAAD